MAGRTRRESVSGTCCCLSPPQPNQPPVTEYYLYLRVLQEQGVSQVFVNLSFHPRTVYIVPIHLRLFCVISVEFFVGECKSIVGLDNFLVSDSVSGFFMTLPKHDNFNIKL